MAVKQYIGARYVPLLDGDYDSNKVYEPLTTVNYGNATYTSKTKVPAGIVPTNRDYWLQTGFGNQQVTGLTDWKNNTVDPFMTQTASDLTNINASLATLSGNIDALGNNLDTAIDDIDAVEAAVDKIERSLSDTAVMIVSDSYGAVTNENGKTSAALFGEYTGIPTHLVAQGGASFQQNTLLAALQAYSTEHDADITTMIIYCGANDCGATDAAVNAGILAFANYARSRFTNLKKMILCGCGLTFGEANGGAVARERLVRCYIDACAKNGIEWCLNSQYVLHNTTLLQSDLCHPNADGVNRLADMLVSAYKAGSDDVHYEIVTPVTLTTSTVAGINSLPEGSVLQIGSTIKMNLDNDVVTISSPDNLYTFLQLALGSVSTVAGRYAIAEVGDTLVQHDLIEHFQTFPLTAFAYVSTGETRTMICGAQIATKKLYIAFTGAFNASGVENVSGIMIGQNSAIMKAH